MAGMLLAGVFLRKYGLQAHFSHQPLNRLVVNDKSLPLQFLGNPRASVNRQFGVDFINLAH